MTKMQKTLNITILMLAVTLLIVSPLAPTPTVKGFEEFRFQSQYGNPTIDGTASLGEWGEWTEIMMNLDDGYNPSNENTLEASIAVMNTGYHLYIGIQIPNQLLANHSAVSEPPWHRNSLDLGIVDGVNKSVMGVSGRWSRVYYEINIGSNHPDFPPDAASGGVPMTETDPTRPRSEYSFTATDGARGTYTFEIVFPLTTMMPIRHSLVT